ncbi:43kDa postsynaptic protein [Parasponia andersonii]|uniref:43kDa postsynaptic protein n=1 Tax=Parasponia andersonii TaxID=3476 RepID=A0A2P5AUI5_PARAD|nr:43kDa postsynaptic protein [Parasponia andersonii]
MESILLPTDSDLVHDHGEEDVEFSYDVKPLSCQRLMDSDQQIRYSFVKVESTLQPLFPAPFRGTFQAWSRTRTALPDSEGDRPVAQTTLSGRDPHEVELLTVQVNLVKHVNVQEYYCLECRRVRERNLKREKLKMNLVYTADDAEARVPMDDASSRTAAGKGDETTTSSTCLVCFVEFGAAGTCAVLTPCSHKFHEKCILTWMVKSPSCPLCRFQMHIV